MAYLAVMAGFTCSLMSKPMLVTLPFLFLVLDWWPLRRADPRTSILGKRDSPQSQQMTVRGTQRWLRALVPSLLFRKSADARRSDRDVMGHPHGSGIARCYAWCGGLPARRANRECRDRLQRHICRRHSGRRAWRSSTPTLYRPGAAESRMDKRRRQDCCSAR